MSKITAYPKTKEKQTAFLEAATGMKIARGYLYYGSKEVRSFGEQDEETLKAIDQNDKHTEFDNRALGYTPAEAVKTLFNRATSGLWVAFNPEHPHSYRQISQNGDVREARFIDNKLLATKSYNICD